MNKNKIYFMIVLMYCCKVVLAGSCAPNTYAYTDDRCFVTNFLGDLKELFVYNDVLYERFNGKCPVGTVKDGSSTYNHCKIVPEVHQTIDRTHYITFYIDRSKNFILASTIRERSCSKDYTTLTALIAKNGKVDDINGEEITSLSKLSDYKSSCYAVCEGTTSSSCTWTAGDWEDTLLSR